MNANPSYISFTQLSRVALPVTLVFTPSVLLLRFSFGTSGLFAFGLADAAAVVTPAAGLPTPDDPPFVVAVAVVGLGVDAPESGLDRATSRRHLVTSSMAWAFTWGEACWRSLFTVTPIFVERRRDSEAMTPVFKSARRRRTAEASEVDSAAFVRSRPFCSTALASRGILAEEICEVGLSCRQLWRYLIASEAARKRGGGVRRWNVEHGGI
jgi:hypothetical protein